MVLLAVPLAVGLAVGCSNKQDKNISAVANPEYVQPIGHIQGIVVDACTMEAIENVEVSISVKGKKKTYTTGNSGQFSFWELPVNVSSGECTDCNCYIVVANFEKYNDDEADDAEDDGRDPRPYPMTVEGEVCLGYEYINNNEGSISQLTVTGSGAATVVDGLTGEVKIVAAKPVATIVGEAYWGKDKTPAEGVALNLYLDINEQRYLEAQAIVDEDGDYAFSAVHECREYVIEPAKPCFVLASSSGYQGEDILALASVLSPEGDLVDTYVECIQLDPIPCLDQEAPCVVSSTPLYNEDIEDLSPTIELVWSELMDTTMPVDFIIEILWDGWKQPDAVPPDVVYDYAWSTRSIQIEGYEYPEGSTPPAVSVLTLTLIDDLLPGSKYQVNLDADRLGLGALMALTDLAGNTYAQEAVACQASVREPDDSELLKFTTRYGGDCPLAEDLIQVANTADNVTSDFYGAPPLEVRNSAYYDYDDLATVEYRTDQAVLSWSRPATGQVKGWRVYARYNANDPWVRVWDELDTTNPLGPYSEMWPPEEELTMDLALIDGQLAAAEVEELPNTNWDDDLEVQIGVSAVTRDRRECPITSITVGDNSCPLMVRNHLFGIDDLMIDQLYTPYYNVQYMDSMSATLIVWPDANGNPSVPDNWSTTIRICDFGQCALQVEFLEDIRANTITGIDFMTDPTPSLESLTYCPGQSDPNDTDDGTIIARYPGDDDNQAIIIIDGCYTMDSGDILESTNVADEAGNVCVGGDWVHFIDTIPAMMQSILLTPATDIMTIVFTERIDEGDAQDNIMRITLTDLGWNTQTDTGVPGNEDVDFGPLACPSCEPDTNNDGEADDGHTNGYTVSHTGDQSTVVVYFDDVSFIRRGNTIALNNLEDFTWVDDTQAMNQSQDDGTWAYWYTGDPSAGAYYPVVSGLGTNDDFIDDIGPRLTPRTANLPTSLPMAAGGPIADGNTFTGSIDNVQFTEPMDQDTGNMTTIDFYTVRLCECETSACDTGTPRLVDGTVTAVAWTANKTGYAVDVDIEVDNNTGGNRYYGTCELGTTTVASITVQASVEISGTTEYITDDQVGDADLNVLDTAHNSYSWDDDADPAPNWVRE